MKNKRQVLFVMGDPKNEAKIERKWANSYSDGETLVLVAEFNLALEVLTDCNPDIVFVSTSLSFDLITVLQSFVRVITFEEEEGERLFFV